MAHEEGRRSGVGRGGARRRDADRGGARGEARGGACGDKARSR